MLKNYNVLVDGGKIIQIKAEAVTITEDAHGNPTMIGFLVAAETVAVFPWVQFGGYWEGGI